MKKRKLRKPRKLHFGEAGYPAAFDCDEEEDGRVVYYDYSIPLTKEDVEKFAKWFADALAWVKEGE